MAYFRHPQAIVESEQVGEGTRVWAFAHILPGARIGRDCNICDHCFIENDVALGDRVTVKCGVYLWDGLRAEDDVFIGPNATFINDLKPRSKQRPKKFLPTLLQRGCSIGAGATVLPNVTVGEGAMVGAGAVVTHNVPREAIVVGNPAHIVGYVGVESEGAESALPAGSETRTRVRGVTLHRLARVEDLRGMLTFGEIGRHVPFEVKRFFLVYDVSSEEIRGEHAHRSLDQFVVCVHGRCTFLADDGAVRQQFELDSPTLGLHIPPLVWSVQYKYSKDAVLLVLASDYYDPADYIRDYAEFRGLLPGRNSAAG